MYQFTAQLNDPRGFFIRSLLSDVVDIFEVNRKECARLLLELPKWLPPATFKPRSGSPEDIEGLEGPLWQLESCILEVRFSLNWPNHKGSNRISDRPWQVLRAA